MNELIREYVANDHAVARDTRVRFPLNADEVQITEDESNPGYYKVKFDLKPHCQLEGLTVALSLVSKLPSEKGGN